MARRLALGFQKTPEQLAQERLRFADEMQRAQRRRLQSSGVSTPQAATGAGETYVRAPVSRPVLNPQQTAVTPGNATVLPARGGEASVRLENAAAPSADEQNAMRIAGQYGGKGTIPDTGQVGYYDKDGNFLGPLYHPETGVKLPMPKGATGIRGTAGTSAPDTVAGQNERNGTQVAVAPVQTNMVAGIPVAGAPPLLSKNLSAPEQPGIVGRVKNWMSGGRGYQPNFVAGPDVSPATLTGVPSLGPNGSDVAAGVSRGQAARIQTPTAASPVPITPTSPERDLTATDQSTAPPASAPTPTGTPQPGPFSGSVTKFDNSAPPTPAATPPATPLPDEWKNRRYQFAGF